MNAALTYDEVVEGLGDLPSLPAVVMELLNSIDQEDVDIGLLARKVSHDQALTAKTLRLANSSAYGFQVKVTTIQQAITYLGFETTRNLITAAAVTGCFAEGKCAGFDHKAFWRHSIGSAACAKVLARHMRFNQDYAFTAGLLHDIGRLVLVSGFPRHYERVLAWRAQHDSTLLLAERTVLGIDHVEAGLALAEHWNFSDTMRLAIGGHHAPTRPGPASLPRSSTWRTSSPMRSTWHKWRRNWCHRCRTWPGRPCTWTRPRAAICCARRKCSMRRLRWRCWPELRRAGKKKASP
ncbi:HDOD domain-containing protein [Pseudoduganella chitinolytica]|uniref:HDOD domain-containing protein n=1 Tax=Pseudoduganella chitinolytica TaxID=34070 RepID=A0ABY8B9V7_9BURK|nr:HDOD domain-containing protein [Pseudoduganella chitinolytica]WEF31159.1 HDOD domain-containing protein [Pseudoduganella chitinolytica]